MKNNKQKAIFKKTKILSLKKEKLPTINKINILIPLKKLISPL